MNKALGLNGFDLNECKSYNNSSSGVNLTSYSEAIFGGVMLTPKRSLKNSFSGVKTTPNIEELK